MVIVVVMPCRSLLQAGAEMMDAETASLWVASRDFQRGEKVGDRLGWNEKTKVVAKLQKSVNQMRDVLCLCPGIVPCLQKSIMC